jgi:hypothetical protein
MLRMTAFPGSAHGANPSNIVILSVVKDLSSSLKTTAVGQKRDLRVTSNACLFGSAVGNSIIRNGGAGAGEAAFAAGVIHLLGNRVPLRPSGTSPCGGGNCLWPG